MLEGFWLVMYCACLFRRTSVVVYGCSALLLLLEVLSMRYCMRPMVLLDMFDFDCLRICALC